MRCNDSIYQVSYVGALGRCPERGLLELHHVVPFADGSATDVANLELRCRAHNAFEADAWFGAVERQGRPEVPADYVRT